MRETQGLVTRVINVNHPPPLQLTIQNNIGPFFLHLFLCLVIFAADSSKALIPIVLFFAVLYHKKNLPFFLVTGVYSVCFSTDLAFYAFAMVAFVFLLIKSRKDDTEISKWLRKCALYFFISCILLYIVQLVIQRSILSLPLFCLTFMSPAIMMFYIWDTRISNAELKIFFRHLLAIALAQAVIAFCLQVIPTGIGSFLHRHTLGDKVFGTTSTSTTLADLLFFSILPFIGSFSFKRNRKNMMMLGLIFLFFMGMIVINDSKTTLAAVLMAFTTVTFFRYIILNTNKLKAALYTLALAMVLTLSFAFIITELNKAEVAYEPYISGEYDKKMQYYQESFSPSTRSILEYVIGTGPGTNGSRSSNSLATDGLYHRKEREALPSFITPKTNDFTRDYLSKLYTADYAETTGSRSAVLGNPFNSICAFFVEFGLLGFIILIIFIFKLCLKLLRNADWLKVSTIVIIITNFITGFIDQTFEIVVPMFLMYLFIGLATRSYSLKIREPKEMDDNVVASEDNLVGV